MRKILILEDNAVLAQTLVEALKGNSREVYSVSSLRAFYTSLEKNTPHLCLMDRMVTDGDSLESVEYIKDAFPKTKILYLSKKAQLKDRIQGLEKGADEYLAKPFSLAEVRLKVKNMLSWESSSEEEVKADLGLISFLPDSGYFVTPEGKISLRKREHEVALHLFRAFGSFFSRQKLANALWTHEEERNLNTIDVYIRRLRKKLGKYKSVIETRRGFGYRFIPFTGE